MAVTVMPPPAAKNKPVLPVGALLVITKMTPGPVTWIDPAGKVKLLDSGGIVPVVEMICGALPLLAW